MYTGHTWDNLALDPTSHTTLVVNTPGVNANPHPNSILPRHIDPLLSPTIGEAASIAMNELLATVPSAPEHSRQGHVLIRHGGLYRRGRVKGGSNIMIVSHNINSIIGWKSK